MRSNSFKFLLVSIAIALLTVLPLYSFSSYNQPKKQIIIERIDPSKDVERSVTTFVDAFCNTYTQIIEITTYSIGYAIVYIVNPNNQVVDYFQFNSDVEPVIYLNSPVVPGIYHLVIESSNFYGIGQFEVE